MRSLIVIKRLLPLVRYMKDDESPKKHVPSDTLQLSPVSAFALLLGTACEQFETLQSLLSGEIKLMDRSEGGVLRRIFYFRADACIRMALAKSFVANVVRARRIIDDGHTFLKVEKHARMAFLAQTKAIIRIRDVNEHGYDVKNNKNRPVFHYRSNSWGDETSLNVDSPNKIFMGPVNLYSICLPTKRMSDLAGFKVNPHLVFSSKEAVVHLGPHKPKDSGR